MRDLFDTKSLSPMLIGSEGEAFNSDEYNFELKLDGVRCLAFLEPGSVELRNKRNLLVSPIYPELSSIHRQIKGRCILDGELTVIVNDKPQFSEIQRRALMSDPFKIKLSATKFPVNFTAFDLLHKDGEDLVSYPLEERQEQLRQVVSESDRLAVSRVIQGHGMALYALTKQQGLEGVVAKRKGSLYYPGKRTKDWIKIKNLLDDDFVVCGYIQKGHGMTSIVLGQYKNGELVYKGHVTLGVASGSYRRITALPSMPSPPYQVPPGNEDATWVQPRLVCSVKFMDRTASGLRQPVFKGLRDDKDVYECLEK